jgi:choline dehydrogenase-like flavoprotein
MRQTGRGDVKQPFNFVQAAILKAFAEALFHDVDMVISADQVVANIQSQFGKVRGNKPKEIGLTLYILCLVLRGPLFLLASPAKRAKWITARLIKTSNNLLQDLARLRSVIYAGYYGHRVGEQVGLPVQNPVFRDIGFTPVEHRTRPADQPQLVTVPGRDLPDSAFLQTPPNEAEVIVVGSGAGGAVAAATLAAKGYQVLIVEAGRYFPLSDLSHHEADMTARIYRDGALQTTKDNDLVVFQGVTVGGSTILNNNICLRLKENKLTHPDAPDVIGNWRMLGAEISETDLNTSFDFIESRLNIRPIDPFLGINNGPHLMDGWKKLAAVSTDPQDTRTVADWFQKNYGPADFQPDPSRPEKIDARCNHCGYCNTSCKYGRKNAMPQTFLQDAVRDGARILTESPVRTVEKQDRDNDSYYASGVTITRADGRLHFIRATKYVVLSAGALESSRILERSGIEAAGDDISLNVACPVPALMPHDCNAWDEDQMTSYIDHGDFLIESHFQPPMSMSVLITGWFSEHAQRMRNYSRILSAGVLFPADRRGWVHKGKLGFKLKPEDMTILRKGLATLCKIHFAQGALECYPALARGQTLKRCSDAEVDAFFDKHVVEPDDVTLSSSHPHGGNCMNADPANGVVGTDLKVHHFNNLYVADASVMPSCIRVNAQLTTMAVAHLGISKLPNRHAVV